MLLTGIAMMGYKLVVTQFVQSTRGLIRCFIDYATGFQLPTYKYHIHTYICIILYVFRA